MRIGKWHGAGNDFVVVDGRSGAPAGGWAAWSRWVCDRHRGVGADGVLVLEDEPGLDFRMHYRNADGGEAAMCGNGGRVLAAFAVASGLGRAGTVRFRSRWGLHEARVAAEDRHRYRVDLELPDVPPPIEAELPAPWGTVMSLLVDCGVPHAVIPLGETPLRRIEDLPVPEWGAALRSLGELGPAGANVDFVARLPDGRFAVRTFERGVEGETLACGTGATATAAAVVHLWKAAAPVEVRTWSGDLLAVHFIAVSGRLTAVRLGGPATRVFEADLDIP